MRIYWIAYREVMSGLAKLGATPAGRADMAGALGALRSGRAAEEAQARLRAKYAPAVVAEPIAPPGAAGESRRGRDDDADQDGAPGGAA